MKISFYGSCQLEAICKVIKLYVNKDVETELILNWIYILNHESLPESIYNCDIFIYQPYNGANEYNTDFILKKIHNKTKLISVPFISTNIYWPDIITDIRNNQTKTKDSPYGLFPQQSCILSKYNTLDEALNNYSSDYYDNEFMKLHINKDFEKMSKVESKCDIKILDFIRNNINERLFHSSQHPANKILLDVTTQILKIINIPIIDIIWPKELLKDHIPIHQRYQKLPN